MNFIKNLLVGGVSVMAGPTNVTKADLQTIINNINAIAQTVVGLLAVAITAVAIYLAFKFFTADEEGKRKNAKAQMIYAIIGVIVLIVILIMIPVITGAVQNAIGTGGKIEEI